MTNYSYKIQKVISLLSKRYEVSLYTKPTTWELFCLTPYGEFTIELDKVTYDVIGVSQSGAETPLQTTSMVNEIIDAVENIVYNIELGEMMMN
ncbi:hypothetical protein N9P60_00530 [bacterium]|nr:hypothetical protein [bacterium]